MTDRGSHKAWLTAAAVIALVAAHVAFLVLGLRTRLLSGLLALMGALAIAKYLLWRRSRRRVR